MGLAFVFDEKGEEEEASSSIPFMYILSITSFYIRGWLCGDRLDFLVKTVRPDFRHREPHVLQIKTLMKM